MTVGIGAIVARLAALLLPGWAVTWEAVDSPSDIFGALAMVWPTPERQIAHIKIAPHPPGESIEASVAHELTHAMISPLTAMLDGGPAAVMLEEQIVERLGNVLATVPMGLARKIRAALGKPRTRLPAVRARISALAVGRLGNGRKRMLSAEQLTKALEALESGDPEATKAILKELIAAMAVGGGEEPAASRDEAPSLEREQEDGGGMGGEKDMPPAAREYMRAMKRTSASMLKETIRLRLHTARTVDGIMLDAATEKDLAGATSIEQFEREFRLVTRQAARSAEQPRKRSGAAPAEEDNSAGALKVDDLVKEGIPERQARDLAELSRKNRVAAQAELDGARLRLRGQAAGGA